VIREGDHERRGGVHGPFQGLIPAFTLRD